MCGLVGVASTGPMTVQMKEFFHELLLHDVIRGHHATGVAGIDTMTNALCVEKKAIPSPMFLQEKEMMESLFAHKHNYNIYMGHNRWATIGAKDADANAHPFVRGDIVGAHNGSLRQQSLLDDHKDIVVDSDNIFHQINKTGLDDTLTRLNGAFALTWYDRKDNSLNFIRNDDRPLAIARLSNGCLVWASEIQMLRWLVNRHKTLSFATVETEGTKIQQITQLEKGQHLQIFFEKNSRKMGEPIYTAKEFPSFPVTTNYRGNGWDDYDRHWNMGRSDQTNTSTVGYRRQGPTPYEEKADRIVKGFLGPNGNRDSRVQVQFAGHHKQKSSGGYEASISIYHYRNNLGEIIKMHCFNHTQNPTATWTEADIGKMVYGKIMSVAEKNSASYDAVINEGINHSISLTELSETRPNKFFAYWDDEAQEGEGSNVLPFREHGAQSPQSKSPETTGEKEPEKSSEGLTDGLTAAQKEWFAGQRANRQDLSLLVDSHGDIILPSDKQESPLDRDVILANTKVPHREFLNAIRENGVTCCNCRNKIADIPMNRLWLIRHKDKSDGDKLNQYIACRKGCFHEMITVIEAIEDDWKKEQRRKEL